MPASIAGLPAAGMPVGPSAGSTTCRLGASTTLSSWFTRLFQKIVYEVTELPPTRRTALPAVPVNTLFSAMTLAPPTRPFFSLMNVLLTT